MRARHAAPRGRWRCLVHPVCAGLFAVLAAAAAGAGPARATTLAALSNHEAAQGLKQALGRGIDAAVAKLGVANGFLDDPRVRIPLPPALARADRLLRLVGLGRQSDALVAAMNHAAEAAVPEGKAVLEQALRQMTIADAKQILTGGDDAGTQYFRRVAYDRLERRFEPVVAQQTRRVGLAQQYDALAAKGAALGLMQPGDASIEAYVTRKALDGLFLKMADEERSIRRDPLGQASSLLRKVFGAVR
ncbi:MAG: DUF4197 domain-containing protein [Gammaproteobacteria bacterium]|nr:DUF4197 domain-containing protein [Gammaproteobacteria bacterium]